jgi:hypothetical protein
MLANNTSMQNLEEILFDVINMFLIPKHKLCFSQLIQYYYNQCMDFVMMVRLTLCSIFAVRRSVRKLECLPSVREGCM